MRGLSSGNGRGGDDECRGDLVARERRGVLSDVEGLALQAHLVVCTSCRLARQVFVDLDGVSGVDSLDGARIERMTTAARRFIHQGTRPAPRARKRRRGLGTMGVVAVLVLLGGTASATAWLWRHPEVRQVFGLTFEDKAPEGFEPAPRRGVAAPAKSAPPANLLGEVVAAEPLPSDVPLPSSSAPPLLRRHAVRAAQLPATPARLLRQASDFRRSGDVERAATLYRKLQRDFPRSSEAVLSSVALGGLLLERNFPRAALGQFDAYLRSSRGGGLIPEALYGRGRALAALGDREEERRTWDRLLADFPDSAYGPLARRRLADLK